MNDDYKNGDDDDYDNDNISWRIDNHDDNNDDDNNTVLDKRFRSHNCGHIQMFQFPSVRMCKSNGDKRWIKQDILRVFWNIQPNHAYKMGVIIIIITIMKTRFYLQENKPRVIATNTHYFYIGILVALWYKKV